MSAVSDSPEDLEFNAWKVEFGKKYNSEEEEARRKIIWLQTRKRVLEHNARAEQGLETYTCGINQFADMEVHEVCCHGACNKTKKRLTSRPKIEANEPH